MADGKNGFSFPRSERRRKVQCSFCGVVFCTLALAWPAGLAWPGAAAARCRYDGVSICWYNTALDSMIPAIRTQRTQVLRGARALATSSPRPKEPYVIVSKQAGVTTLKMNRPKQLNGWTFPMMSELRAKLTECQQDPDTRVCVITGTGKYYCAGVNLSSMIKPMHPAKLHELIRSQNQSLFDMFLNFPKPIIACVQGPAIGASVTSATLCDAILCSETATFSTPFFRLGVPPEGCSSVNFPRFMGDNNAERMMGSEAWVPNAKEALEIGLAQKVVSESDLLESAQEMGEEWIAAGKQRALPHGGQLDELLCVNAEESALLADAFTSEKFLEGQRAFLSSKGKTVPSMVFAFAKLTRPLWSQLLPPSYDKQK